MSLSVGIVGLPNVGKSTLFNALLGRQQALAANYPFATIEPNVGIVPVPDERLPKLAEIVKTEKIVPAVVEFLDIAGLVAGAASGEGLGNQFLAHIREADLICQVLRVFEDKDVVLTGKGPKEDYETIEAELILKDLESVQKRMEGKEYRMQKGMTKEVMEKLLAGLNGGKPARELMLTKEEKEVVRDMFLLTMKPEIIALNLGEDQLKRKGELVDEVGGVLGLPVVGLSAKMEADLAELGTEDMSAYLAEVGIDVSGLGALVKLAYEKLGLISFLTAGEMEVRAWTVKRGSLAPVAAGVIHTDFEKNFIKAKVVSYEDFVEDGGWKGAAEAGHVRMEGRDYVMNEGDVVEFMIGK